MKTWIKRSALLGASLWTAGLTAGCVVVVGEHDDLTRDDASWSGSWPESGERMSLARVDEGLARQAQSRIASEPALAGEDITVSARGDVVTLHGRVPSLAKLEQAMNAAAGTPGVSRVVSRLTVEREAL